MAESTKHTKAKEFLSQSMNYFQNGKMDLAMAKVNESIKKDTYFENLCFRGKILFNLDKFKESQIAYRRCYDYCNYTKNIPKHEDLIEFYALWANTHQEIGMHTQAVNLFEFAIDEAKKSEKSEKRQETIRRLEEKKFENKKFDEIAKTEAEKYKEEEKAEEQKELECKSMWKEAASLMNQKEYERALIKLDNILETKSTPQLLRNRGLCYMELEEYTKARKDLEESLQLYKDRDNYSIEVYTQIHFELVDCEKYLNNYDKAIAKLHRITDSTRVTTSNKVKANLMIKELEELNGFVKRIIDVSPKNSAFSEAEINLEKERISEYMKKGKEDELQEGSIWFLVSMKWYKRWCDFTGFEVMSGEVSQEYPGPITNEDLIDFNTNHYLDPEETKDYTNIAIKRNINEKINYILVSHEHWHYWKQQYGGFNIKRFVIPKSDEANDLYIEVHLQSINFVFLPKRYFTIKEPRPMFISRKEDIGSAKAKILRILTSSVTEQNINLDPNNYIINLWKLDPNETLDGINHELSMHTKRSQTNTPCPINAKLLDQNIPIEEAELCERDLIIVELISTLENSNIFKEKKEKGGLKNGFARSIARGETEESKIESVGTDWMQTNFVNMLPKGKKGATGLQNLGNTCYMNSAIQCLSHTTELTQYFLKKLYVKEFNKNNVLGTGGYLANYYGELMSELWEEGNRSVSAWNLKRVIARFGRQFNGYEQHDSQEFLNYLLDGLHEDLNRVRKKPYMEEKDYGSEADEQLASLETWNYFKSRNDSVIVDLFFGQLKSRITCPHCEKIQIKFDPFMSLSLPIPIIMKITLLFVCRNISDGSNKISLVMPHSCTLEEIALKILNYTKKKESDVVFAWIIQGKIVEFFDSKRAYDAVEKSFNGGYLIGYEVPQGVHVKKFYPVQIRIEGVLETMFSTKIVEFSYPWILFMERKRTTILELRREIYKTLEPFMNKGKYDVNGAGSVEEEYGMVFSGGEKPPYYLLLSNNLGYDRTQKYNKKKVICEFCNKSHTDNCEFQLRDANEDEVTLDELLNEIMKYPRIFALILRCDKESSKEIVQIKQLRNIFEKPEQLQIGSGKAENKMNVYQCLKQFCEEEQLDSDNCWHCPNCKKTVQAYKKIQIFRLPKILILHLKRFKQGKSSYYGMFSHRKMTEFIDYPEGNLDMGDFAYEGEVASTGGRYNLFAVSNHMGGMGGGHYTATCFNPAYSKWVYCDDSSISKASHDDIVSKAGYVLFYRLQGDSK